MRNKNYYSLKYNIPLEFRNYGSWDYLQTLPAYDTNLFNLAVKEKGLPFLEKAGITASSKVRTYYRWIKYKTDEFKELSIKFDKFKSENSWIEEYYRFCLKHTTYVEDPFDVNGYWISLVSTNPDDIPKAEIIKHWLDVSPDFHRFCFIAADDSLMLMFNEIKRDLSYVVGNLVKLRTRFLHSKIHDPFYYHSDLKEVERVGYIKGITDETHSNSYNGKGSRLVEVYWSATGDVRKQSISSIKLFDQKNNKMVDKLVDE